MKKILYISARNILDKGFIGRPHYFIKALSHKYDVFIYHKPQYWKSLSRESSEEYKGYFNEHVRIYHGYPIRLFKDIFLSEVINLPANISNIRKIVRDNKIDLVMSPDVMLWAYGIFLPRSMPKVFLFDDFYPFLFGVSQNPFIGMIRWIVKSLMDASIKSSKLVISCSQALDDYVRGKTVPHTLVSNGTDMPLSLSGQLPLAIQQLKSTGKLILGFIGGVREYMDLGIPIQALAKLKETNDAPLLLIVGDGPAKNRFLGMSKELKVDDRVIFAGRIDKKDIFGYINAMDICIIPFKKNPLTEVTRPLKFFEYLACAKPVIMTEIKEINDFFGGSLPAFVGFANNPDDFVNKYNELKSYLGRESFRQELKDYSRKIADTYNWDVLSSQFVGEIDKILR